MKAEKKELFITHLFNASADIVFHAWTDPEVLKDWYAPDGCTIEIVTMDVRQGGRFHSCIHDPVHGACWIKGEYLEVASSEKLVFTMILSDEEGNSVSSVKAGKAEEWPEELLTTVTFEPVGERTKVSVHQTVPEVEAKKTGAYQSWFKMFHKLERMLGSTR